MAIIWQDIFGGAQGTVGIPDVHFIGSQKNSYKGMDLTAPHAENKGRGLGFEQIGNTVKVYASLVGIGVDGNGNNNFGDIYFPYDGTYDWFLKIYASSNGANGNYTEILNQQIASHQGNPPLGMGIRWRESAIEYSTSINIPKGTTHIKVSVHERDRTDFSRDPIFPIERVLPPAPPPPPPKPKITTRYVANGKDIKPPVVDETEEPKVDIDGYRFVNTTRGNNTVTHNYQELPRDFRPWATRKGGTWKSHQTNNGWFKIRKGKNWQDISTMAETDKGANNKGKHRIRKTGTWKGQSNIGR